MNGHELSVSDTHVCAMIKDRKKERKKEKERRKKIGRKKGRKKEKKKSTEERGNKTMKLTKFVGARQPDT